MARIGLIGKSYSRIPEGITVLQISEIEDKYDDFGKLVITLKDSKGRVHKERYTLLTQSGELNETALWYYSQLARAALNLDPDDTKEYDTDELLGKYIRCNVYHEVAADGKTYSRLDKEKEHADGFDDETSSFDLDDIL